MKTIQQYVMLCGCRVGVEAAWLSLRSEEIVPAELYCTCYGRSEEIVPAGLDRFVSCDSEGETDIFIPDRVDTLSER